MAGENLPNVHIAAYKPNIVKWFTKVGGTKNFQKTIHVVYVWPKIVLNSHEDLEETELIKLDRRFSWNCR